MALFNGDIQDNTIQGSAGNDTIRGFAGNDTLFGNAGSDDISGDQGDDILHSGDGDDVLTGGTGNDTLVFTGSGSNTGDGGEGTDTVEIDLTHLDSTVEVTTFWQFHVGALTNYSLLTSDQSFDVRIDGFEKLIIRSGAGDDHLNGTRGKDRIHGNDGDDILGDFRFGGNDQFYGGAGNDVLVGQTRNVRLFGGSGDDTFQVGYSSNASAKGVINGGSGQDLLWLTLGSTKDQTITFESGVKNVQSNGLTIDRVETLRLVTSSGDDTLVLKAQAPGVYQWHANGGSDHATLDLSDIKGQAQFGYGSTQGSGVWTNGEGEVNIGLIGIEGLTIIGNDQKNTFRGGSFRNEFKGGDGNDNLTGGSARDLLFGENGDDTLGGGEGNDLLNGGTGDDDLLGGHGDDRLLGSSGKDLLEGDFGDDTLIGGRGRDRLDGGWGDDTLTGGAGRDLFVFTKGEGTDQILDFELGLDRIDLRGAFIRRSDLQLTQENGYVEITLSGDNSADPTTIQVMNVTLAELDNAANFIF
jgi:Ca2+-binding RTX toxin-like protein